MNTGVIIDTFVPGNLHMPDLMQKHYQRIEVKHKTVLSSNDRARLPHNGHGAHSLFFATRPLWNYKVYCIEALDHQGYGSFDGFLEALEMAASLRPAWVNASLGFSGLRRKEIKQLKKLSNILLHRGTALIAAGGNEGINPITGQPVTDSVCYPAKLNQWLATGSSQDGKKSDFSSFGKEILWTLDGQEELSVGFYGEEAVSGTSFSAPKLAGIIGRIGMEMHKIPHVKQVDGTWPMTVLPWFCKKKYRTNKYDILNHDEKLGFGSLEWLYRRMCTDYDRYKENGQCQE